ncbi:hypothetical protein EDD29_8620 [Actinocorallia herbida]|uniref:SPW repeat-containing protein n=1 Tax=Actinocorallia herbida TaxID=58109 RepID=A0A3N1DBJ6_9ACTN|nr:hypothetical protein [Actinocorallia herbida]ROO90879.1 hypothetical protein EDD29_8620 [Actinocorallia herbida]
MQQISRNAAPFLLLALAAAANWAAWLGWDQRYDTAPDGSVSGPYQAWQVAGLVVVLAALLIGGAVRFGALAAFGPTLGMFAAVVYDWSDDDSGLWAVGASMVVLGMFFATLLVVALAGNARRMTAAN